LYDVAADLTREDVNYVINFPCEEVGADQLGSGAISSKDAFVSKDPDDMMAYCWLAMARFYEKNGLLNDQMDHGDVMAYRWLALAQFYEKNGLLSTK
jgi:hypothetical protein